MILLDLLLGFLKVGFFAFGGAYAAVPLIRDVVLEYGWISEDMLANIIAVSESTPGPIMVNLATYVGSTQAGVLGSLIATTAVVLPSFVITILIMVLMKKFMENPYMKAVLGGLKPCIIGIILSVGIHMLYRNLIVETTVENARISRSPDLTAGMIAIALALVYFAPRKRLKDGIRVGQRRLLKNGLSPIGLIVISALVGILVYGGQGT